MLRLFRAGGVISALLMLTCLSTALLSMPVRLALLANGHGAALFFRNARFAANG